MSGSLSINWTPPGPVAQRFMASRARVQIINGPVGSGKTTTAAIKLVRIAGAQAPSKTQTGTRPGGVRVPVRRVKFCVVRDTYRQLWKTTLPSWFERIPRDVGHFVGSEGQPASHQVTFQLSDGTLVDLAMDFVAIGDNNVEDTLRGYQPTGFYLNEADLLSRDVFTYAQGRTGRFPPMSEGGPTWHGVLMDCNAPEFGSWLYDDIFLKSAEELAASGIELFRQPGGRDPKAENTANLPAGYYDAQCQSQPDWYVSRMVDNKPGYSRAGKPIYPEFNDTLHVPDRDLEPIPGLSLSIGLDAGLNPAAVFGQHLANGQWRIIDELVGDNGTGPRRFAAMLAQRLTERFGQVGPIKGFADPSAAYGADRAAGEQSWIEIVESVAQIRVNPAPTNALIPRLEAVRLPLTRLIDGVPGLLLSPRCKALREGFNAGYRFRKIVGAGERYGEEPDKNRFSHPHDALQYLCSAGGEDLAIRDRKAQRGARPRMRASDNDWNPLAMGEAV